MNYQALRMFRLLIRFSTELLIRQEDHSPNLVSTDFDLSFTKLGRSNTPWLGLKPSTWKTDWLAPFLP